MRETIIGYTIEATVKSRLFERIIVSTDSERYAAIAKKFGAEVMMRSEALSNDKATSFMVIKDVLERVQDDYDYFVLLQPIAIEDSQSHPRSYNQFRCEHNGFRFSCVDERVRTCSCPMQSYRR